MVVDYLEYWHTVLPPHNQPGAPHFDRRLLAFVVRRDKPVVLIGLGPASDISEAVAAWRKDFGASRESDGAGQRLRERLWDPLEPELSGVKFVLVSPDGSLGMLPLAALPSKEPGKYLLQDWAITIVPAPQAIPVLLMDQQRERPRGNLLLIGGVDYDAKHGTETNLPKKAFGGRRAVRLVDGAPFAPLEATRGEIASLEKMYRSNFGREGIQVLEGGAARELAFRREAPDHLYLHLATHGFFAPPTLKSALATYAPSNAIRSGEEDGGWVTHGYSPGLLSGLALAGANHPEPNADDGIVTAEEIQTLDLTKVDLAVLSACETGLGEVAGGEGLLGLQRAFQVAGARTTIASLWTVADRETRDLMERFYANVWEKEMDKLTALREAQLWMLQEGPRRDHRLKASSDAAQRQTSPPYYWAAFVLSGDWR